MKKTIRKSLFETNSSSMHTLCINTKDFKVNQSNNFYDKWDKVLFEVNEYDSYDFEEGGGVYDKASYIWSCLFFAEQDKREEYKNKIIDELNKVGIKAEFEEESDCDSMDHCWEHVSDIYALIDNGYLIKFLFNPESTFFYGNDNSLDYEDFNEKLEKEYNKNKDFIVYTT